MFQKLIDDFFREMERDAEYEQLEELEEPYDQYLEAPEPLQWPKSRSFNPPPHKSSLPAATRHFRRAKLW